MDMRDMDGEKIAVGDAVCFSYGIPPVRVEGVVFERDGKLWLPTLGHKPEEAKLTEIKKHAGGFYKCAMTKSAWIDACAARYMRVANVNEELALEMAGACFENVAGDLGENPADCADEDMSCWTND